ncbi:NACHT domain-containing protein [Leptothoe sp. PORK10 BA2]|uniref:NACHT domain-containing protein n=1 Tax=Leptothoe sp. PORK10 BA2 TaxID=3110254 RepID=UPI002B209B78|nr:NACHT domain-containing protein [Leptothoe sp. PORK10 BA2]MEA5464294.1 NACHT domain-containing protein [Leptothoe sp. PORK10 BA2]
MSELFSGTGEGLARLGLEILGKGSSAVTGEISQRWFNASGKYIANYNKRHCQLKVLGMREPVDLARVYTGVKLLGDDDIMQFESRAALEESYRKTRFRGYVGRQSDGEKRSGIAVANKQQYLMVLGGPGAGKSTFLRKMGLESLKTLHHETANYHHHCVPVLLELKRFEADAIDIPALIAQEFATCDFPEPEQFTQKALKQGKLLILLDGLDEVPTANLNNVIGTIQDFVDRYDQNRFIASCRTAAYHGGFTRFSDVGMADFDDEQIEQFIGNWFSHDQDRERETGKKCWEILKEPKNQAAKELAHTPLLLTYLCLVYDRSQRFPANRSNLYQRALRILLEEWSAEKRINRDKIYAGLSIELEEQLLSEMAYGGFETDQLFFSRRELTSQIKDFLASNLNVPKTLDGEAVLQAIEVQQGILVERAEDAYSFSHLTLQEYLTAQYLADNNQWDQIISNHVTENRWREVLLLVPGLLTGKQGSNLFLETLEQRANDCLQSSKLHRLLQWATESTEGAAGNFSQATKRIAAISLALYLDRVLDLDLARALVLARDLYLDRILDLDLVLDHALVLARDHSLVLVLVRDRARVLDLDLDLSKKFSQLNIFASINFPELIDQLENIKSRLPSNEASEQQKQNFREIVLNMWVDALGIAAEDINLSEKEIKELIDYLYICELMVRCKEAAVRVSPDIWAGIESRILTVPAA